MWRVLGDPAAVHLWLALTLRRARRHGGGRQRGVGRGRVGPRWRRGSHRRSNHRRGGQDVAATESTRSSAGWPVPHPRRSPRRPPTPRRGSRVLGDADPSGPARRAVKRKIVRRWASHGFAPSRPHDRRRRPVVSGRQPGPIPAARARGSVSPCREADPGQRVRQPRRLRRLRRLGTSGRSGWTDSTSAAVSPINASAAQRRSRPRSEERQCRGNGGRCAGPWDRRLHVGDSIHIRAALPGRWAARIAHCPSGSPRPHEIRRRPDE